MEPKVNYVIVGAFVVILSALLVAVVLWLGTGYDRAVYDRYYAYMEESVAGLSVDAAVKYRGVEVGRVKEIILNPENPEEVRLTLEIVRGTPIKEDTIVTLNVQGLTGLAIVDLTGGSRDSPPLDLTPGQPYPIIQTGPSLFVRFDRAITELLTNLNRVTKNLDTVLDDQNRKSLSHLLQDMATLTHSLADKKSLINDSVKSAAHTMENIEQTTKTLNEELPLLIERMYGSVEALEAMADTVTQTSRSVGGVVQDTKPDIQKFSRHTLNEMNVLVTELRQLTATLQRAGQQLEQEPNSLIFGRTPPPPGPGE